MNYVKFVFSVITLFSAMSIAAGESYKVYVDDSGVMRRGDTHQEVSYYGVNYTVPFAHAYRALGSLGIDHRKAIDRDVYHMSRLGFNAYRIHIWDVEISDSVGNLIENTHLDLLDYLIWRLEERKIKVIITAQTNFGNGYPERNTDLLGAYTYDYEKCRVHDEETAIVAQERYIRQLVEHQNPYTHKTYAADTEIIALEINNEPCHSGSAKDVTRYINRMVKSLQKGKWDKPILYNVSHNWDVTQGFYDADIDGTTYQWYPVNLVAGRTRQGNFLPYMEDYHIPFADKVKGFDRMARVVYEFDPADNLYSYLFPAAARTFRKAGFQWITQFSYDPIDMAWSNSEYQTHFLNLAYTPRKALSMMIAGEVARTIERGADYGKYPVDTIFGDFLVSSRQDLAMLNDGKKYLYTNNTVIAPKHPTSLTQVAGWGNSPVVKYEGTGAYFLDRLSEGVWRLEVMPDIELTSDPFARPSLDKRVGEILYCENRMTLSLSDLGDEYFYKAVNEGNNRSGRALQSEMSVYPGVYILAISEADLLRWNPSVRYGDGTKEIGEYVAPEERAVVTTLLHTPRTVIEQGEPLTIRARIVSEEMPDSIVLFPDNVSFWSDHNRLYKMERVGCRDYEVTIAAEDLDGRKIFGYNLVVYEKEKHTTYPQNIVGAPLDWNYIGDASTMYHSEIVASDAPIVFVAPDSKLGGTEISTIPASWHGLHYYYENRTPISPDVLRLSLLETEQNRDVIISKYVAAEVDCRRFSGKEKLYLAIESVEGLDSVSVGLVNRDGFTYSDTIPVVAGIVEIDPTKLKLSPTLLCPEPYPSFMLRTFEPDAATATPLRLSDIEKMQVVVSQKAFQKGYIELRGVWLD